jgi:hypothetical protein
MAMPNKKEFLQSKMIRSPLKVALVPFCASGTDFCKNFRISLRARENTRNALIQKIFGHYCK